MEYTENVIFWKSIERIGENMHRVKVKGIERPMVIRELNIESPGDHLYSSIYLWKLRVHFYWTQILSSIQKSTSIYSMKTMKVLIVGARNMIFSIR